MKKFLVYLSPLLLFSWLMFILPGCRKYLPTDRDYFDRDAQFTQDVYMPVTGRNTLFNNNFNAGNSSLPLTFKLVNPRRRNGDPAPELLKTFPTLVWTAAYTGKETSLEEITDKRKWEAHPLFEIREHSGQMMMWATASSRYLHCQPDSGYLFDVEVSNSGGRKFYKDLKLIPYRERPYEPTNQDAVTGANQSPAVHPAQVVNVRGASDDAAMLAGDIDILFHKTGESSTGKEGKTYTGSLTFKFLDSSLNPIDPDKFNLTDWAHLVHGFDMEKTDEYIRYTIGYPIPLIDLQTRYTTNDGSQAHVVFSYERQGFGDKREVAQIEFNFNIYEAGNWEIIFWFRKDNPKFEDD